MKKPKLFAIDATPDETLFAAQSIVKGYNDIVNQCNWLDQQIASLTAQRAALQPSLEAATSLAVKVKAELPEPPEVEPPEDPPIVSPPIVLPEPAPAPPPEPTDLEKAYVPDPIEVD